MKKKKRNRKGRHSFPCSGGCGQHIVLHEGFSSTKKFSMAQQNRIYCKKCRAKHPEVESGPLPPYIQVVAVLPKGRKLVANTDERVRPYIERNRILRKMGFKTYQDYLESELWYSIKCRVFKKKGRSCSACGEFAGIVHHKSYAEDVLRGKNLQPLIPICFECHEQIEFENEERTYLEKANRILKTMVKDNKPKPFKHSRFLHEIDELFDRAIK